MQKVLPQQERSRMSASSLRDLGKGATVIASEIGYKRSCVGRWLSGKARPLFAQARAIETRYGIPTASWGEYYTQCVGCGAQKTSGKAQDAPRCGACSSKNSRRSVVSACEKCGASKSEKSALCFPCAVLARADKPYKSRGNFDSISEGAAAEIARLKAELAQMKQSRDGARSLVLAAFCDDSPIECMVYSDEVKEVW